MIASVTLNPALDKIMYGKPLRAGSLNRVDKITTLIGGKGINMAVILKHLQQEIMTLGLLGGFVGQFIGETLEQENITIAFEYIDNDTRTNIIFVEPNGRSTQILEPGPEVSQLEVDELLANYKRSLTGCHCIILAGSLPPGVPVDIYEQMVNLAKDKNIFSVVNARGEALSLAVKAGPGLVKPDVRFSSEVFGINTASRLGRRRIADLIIAQGVSMLVIDFNQCSHAIYTTEQSLEVTVPAKQIKSTIVAGDAFLAGLVDALQRQRPLAEAAIWAGAVEIAAGQEMEKRWALPEEVSHFLDLVKVEEIK